MYSGTLRNVASLSRRMFNGKRKPVILTFTASATWKVPKGVTKVDVFLVGGGGNGGSGYMVYNSRGYGGGGGGGGNVAVMQNVPVTPDASISIVVGAASGQSAFGSCSVLGGTNGTSASSASNGVGGNGNSGGGGGSYPNGGIQSSSSGSRLINSIGAAILKDFYGIYYGNGGGRGGFWIDTSNYVYGGTAGSGAGAGGNSPTPNYSGNMAGGDGVANSGGGGGGGAGNFLAGTGLGGAGGSGLVQIRYWKE